MLKHLCKDIGVTENQENMSPPPKYSKPSVIGPEEWRSRNFPAKTKNDYCKDTQRAMRKHDKQMISGKQCKNKMTDTKKDRNKFQQKRTNSNFRAKRIQ